MDDINGKNDEELEMITEMLSSDDAETRIKARRMRMARLDALTKTSDHSPKLTASEIQLKTSSQIIAELLDDTQFSITNVRRAAVKKEELRQENDKIEREEVKELIAKEAGIAGQKFQNIDSQWLDISLGKDPLNIHGRTENQREKCVDLLEQKDSIIDELKLKLKEADSNFFEELLQQNQYVNILSDRINDQINLMAECYRQELIALEKEINSEKDNLIDERRQQWNELASEKEDLELGNIKQRYDLIEQYALDLDSMLVELHEKMRKTRIDCQSKIQDFSLELDSLKNACLINTEKLQYNFHVLQIRRDENYEMKSQQKRTLNRLQDQISTLKERRIKEFKAIKNEIVKLRKELMKTTESMADTQRRHIILASTSDKKFFKLWDYNQKLADENVKELNEAEKCFHEELFGKSWEPPNKINFNRDSMQSYVAAVNLIKGDKERLKLKLCKNDEIDRILRALLISLGENGDFVLDDALEQIACCLTGQDRSLIIADKFFQLIGMTNSFEANLMAQAFAPYVKCASCDDNDSKNDLTDDGQVLLIVDQTVQSQIDLMASMTPEISRRSIKDDEIIATGTSPQLYEIMDEQPEFKLLPTGWLCFKPGHKLVLERTFVSKALNEFIVKMKESRSPSLTDSTKPLSVSRLLNENEIKIFWSQYTVMFDCGKVEKWKALLSHMKEYYKLLLKRKFYNDAINKMKSSNLDLRRLLQRYLKPKDLTAKQLEIDSKFRSAIFDPPLKSLSSLDLS